MEYGAFVAVEDVYNKALAYSTPFGHAWYVFWGRFWYNYYLIGHEHFLPVTYPNDFWIISRIDR